MQLKLDNNVSQFADEIEALSGLNLYDCYQCGKCSAGCPVSQFTQESPTRLIRLIQLNQKETVLNSKTPYLCASCSTCSERCPMEIDVAKVMETVRILASREGVKPAVKEVVNFSGAFLDSVKSNGRLFEFGMTISFNLRNRTPLKDAMLGPVMLQKGKLGLFPQSIKNKEKIKNIFNNSSYFEPKEEKKEH
ncbi:MAG: heterodisulfide reductase subunit C [Ignavibacteria bacterium]|jgi:heterodisulfide reductase subunit C|nr:heterodisulfide reductase subunit C [Ignavibacteria bacterium]MCU7521918.1 heterodisulfide reductase subunit C [Ignavibacteria bacterium]